MPEPFEIHAELDEGFRIVPGPPETSGTVETWQGIRVKYRPLGSRGRWSRFLLEYDEQPSIAQLQNVCAEHEKRADKGGRNA